MAPRIGHVHKADGSERCGIRVWLGYGEAIIGGIFRCQGSNTVCRDFLEGPLQRR
jgi:hypothetical protein